MRLVGPTRWHVTLQFVGEVGEESVAELGEAVSRAAAQVSGPLDCVLGPATGWFAGVKVLQVPASGLDALAAIVRTEIAGVDGVELGGGSSEPFNGHLTIGRARGRGKESGKGPAAALVGIPFSSSFPVSSIDLVQSEPTPNGHRYSTVVRAELESV